jgi:hypothetical protein
MSDDSAFLFLALLRVNVVQLFMESVLSTKASLQNPLLLMVERLSLRVEVSMMESLLMLEAPYFEASCIG